MKLWLISQDVNGEYDTYDSAVVAAADAAAAKSCHPNGSYSWKDGAWRRPDGRPELFNGTWAPPDQVTAKYVGEAAEDVQLGDIICASFNAG